MTLYTVINAVFKRIAKKEIPYKNRLAKE